MQVEGKVGEEKRVVIKKQERLVRGKRNTKVVSFECLTTFEALYVFMQVFFLFRFFLIRLVSKCIVAFHRLALFAPFYSP
jgi:hypothetical protein